MTDHADTIRRAIMASLSVTGDAYTHDEYDAAHAALDALVAERQQAIDERDAWKESAMTELREKEQARARYEQAIYALREIELWPFDVNVTADQDVAAMKERARAALLSLGEQP